MTQYAVVWRPDLTHIPRALGPFRSRASADAAQAEMLALENELGIGDEGAWIPEVVALERWSTVRPELREINSQSHEQESSGDA